MTRIVIGYFIGVGLLGFAIKFKKKYENFSAILLSGSIAILYVITYLAYSMYGLMPQLMAFALMLIFTVFTIIAAINYNKQVIALIGLVGAYAVPFLLSNGSGNVQALFTYITIVNIGILIIAIMRYWRGLYYSAFSFTWLLFLGWYFSQYEEALHFKLALVTAFIFYLIFYITFLVYKIAKKEKFNVVDVILIFLNTFIFYVIGYKTLSDYDGGESYLGLFTVFVALMNFIVSYIIYKRKKCRQKSIILHHWLSTCFYNHSYTSSIRWLCCHFVMGRYCELIVLDWTN